MCATIILADSVCHSSQSAIDEQPQTLATVGNIQSLIFMKYQNTTGRVRRNTFN